MILCTWDRDEKTDIELWLHRLCRRTYDAHMFFFHFEAREAPEEAPVVLWMTGGPGCSSELAVFYENGPYSLNEDLEVEETPYGWDNNAHMIFVDQPVNTGFSYSDDDRDRCYDEACVSDDMLDFLQELFKVKKELQGRDFFVTGESYAGHYGERSEYNNHTRSRILAFGAVTCSTFLHAAAECGPDPS